MLKTTVDKLSLIYTVHDKELYKAYLNMMYSATLDLKEKGYKLWKTKYTTGATFPLSSGKIFTMLAGIAHKNLWIVLDFNAGHLLQHDQDKSELNAILEVFFQDGLTTLLEKARIRLIEFAVDVDGYKPSDVVIAVSGIQSCNLKYEQQGTIYAGKKQSAKSFKAYDKTKELEKKGQPTIGGNLLRIEARLRNLKMPPIEINNTIKNPFEKIVVADKAALMLQKPNLIWKYLGKDIEAGNSILGALLSLPSPLRRKLIKQLKMYAFPWWNPQKIWESFPPLSEFISPKSICTTSLPQQPSLEVEQINSDIKKLLTHAAA